MKKEKEIKVVWALDPYEENARSGIRSIEALLALVPKRRVLVYPTYVHHLPWFDFPEPKLERLATVSRAVHRAVGSPNLEIGPSKIIESPRAGLRAQADLVVKQAHDVGASMICVATQANRGLDRLLLGSFAETLVQRSSVPVIGANPALRLARGRGRRFLFATDFSAGAMAAFDQFLRLAADAGASVEIFHQFNDGVAPPPGAAYGVEEFSDRLYGKHREAAVAKLARWKSRARKRGIKATTRLGEKAQSAWRAIAERSGDFAVIGLAAQSGPWETWFLGSTARRVLRDARCPVWVFHASIR